MSVITILVFLLFKQRNDYKLLNLVCSVLNFNVWLRFIGLFLVDPLVEENPAYTTVKNLWIEFWSCMREFPEVATKNGKTSKVKEYTKDRSFYHIILLLFLELLTLDVVATWITSFSSREINALATERPMLFFIFFVAANILLTSTFNSIGYALQLFYCIFIEGGSYSSEQWRPMMNYPVKAKSLNEFWSQRWHQVFKQTWLAIPFRPVRILSARGLSSIMKNPKSISFMLAFISVFVISALMHEYAIAANHGLSIYRRFFMGEQLLFFMAHALGVLIEQTMQATVVKRWLIKSTIAHKLIGHIWTVTFGYFTFYYIMNGFISSEFYAENPIRFLNPYILRIVRETPALRPYFGSYIY
ncbi:hypothetical protein CU097_006804 [Rhizopus azygosporus]|uniref:Wax synthase domain-containing protein n=1 Tax=Rhizopus azygosporus TaxID=86630 RepID=A0A367JI10_RHIAZ|nr:hypothetical protein CU097_006804 [Rhizopus azygosporus]